MNLPRMSMAGERALAAATQVCVELDQLFFGVEHLFLGLLVEDAKSLDEALGEAGDTDSAQLAEAVRARLADVPDGAAFDEHTPTPRCRAVFDLSVRIAARSGKGLVEPAHLWEAIFTEGRSVPVRVLRGLGVDVGQVQERMRREPESKPTPTPLLAQFGRDLTDLAERGQLGPVIGRADEMDLLSQVLLRKNKNNPVLVGEAGVGKTAVVEGFAQRLASKECPEPLRGRRIVELSVGALVAGTKFRGEFEERLLGIAKEVGEHPEIVLFLDEIHTLVGAGATGGGDSLDASNILKPALARGEMRCIGATTVSEYRLHIEQDPALERRFEKVMVEEPSREDALEILGRLRGTLEEHHQVRVQPEAVEAAVDLTIQHVRDRQLPDKALDALDQTCARKRLRRYADHARRGIARDAPVLVSGRDVASTVSSWTGIPLEKISGEAARGLLNLEGELSEKVVGQAEAVRAVARTVLTAKAGLNDPDRPLGVFFFAGPTGVGKTHLAKTLAETLFGDGKRLVRIDMSEYAEPHSVANLIGAPPGYVGHEKEGLLISALRTHPHCVVLFDEVEKAHPKVFDLFLQIFDEGRLTGTRGKTADFTQAIVVLTSNVDTGPGEAYEPVGFGGGEAPEAPAEDPRGALMQLLRPELVNRIDEVVTFRRLAPEVLRGIVDHHVDGIRARLEERKLRLDLAEEVYDHLIALADCQRFGARDLQRAVDKHLRQPLAHAVLEHGDRATTIRVVVEGEALLFEPTTSDEGLPA